MPTPGSTLFTASANQRLQVADAAPAAPAAGQAMMFGGWFHFASLSGQQILLSKGSAQSGGTLEYALFLFGGVGFQAFCGDGTTFNGTGYASPGGFAAGSWHFLLGWFDPAGGATINFQCDDGSVTSSAATGIAPITSGTFAPALLTAGYDPGTPGSGVNQGNPFDGRMNSLFAIRRATAFTTAERTWLYNAGTGRVAADLGASGTGGEFLAPASGSGDWWDLDDDNGSHVGAFHGVVLASVDSGGPLTPTYDAAHAIPRMATLGPSFNASWASRSANSTLGCGVY